MWPKLKGIHFESVASLILRIPGIFIVDHWWQSQRTSSDVFEWWDVALAALVPVHGVLLLVLPLEHLVDLYMHYLSGSLLVVAHLFSQHYVQVEQQWTAKAPLGLAGYLNQRGGGAWTSIGGVDHDFLKRQGAALFVHMCIATTVAFLLDLQHGMQRMLLAAYTLPVVARLSGFLAGHDELGAVHNFASAFVLIHVIHHVLKRLPAAAAAVVGACRSLLRGADPALPAFVLPGPIVLLLFWLAHMLAQLYCHVRARSWGATEWHVLLLRCASHVCNSPISLLATAVALSYASRATLAAATLYLHGFDRAAAAGRHSGWAEGLTMGLIAAQTGLINLRMPYRAAVMSIALFIVFSSLVQSTFEIAEPVVLALSASRRAAGVAKHVRALSLCALLFAAPLYVTLALCSVFPVDFWMLVVVSGCVLTSVQALGLVVVYALFAYDAVDEVVYCARAATRLLEFGVAVAVVGVGVRETLAGGQAGWLGSAVLAVHCYFNVWQRLQAGWKSFLLRRNAARRVNALPVAGAAELQRYGDVCAICYGEMAATASVRVTACGHLYHENCLRKWMHVQPTCPMCHAPVVAPLH